MPTDHPPDALPPELEAQIAKDCPDPCHVSGSFEPHSWPCPECRRIRAIVAPLVAELERVKEAERVAVALLSHVPAEVAAAEQRGYQSYWDSVYEALLLAKECGS